VSPILIRPVREQLEHDRIIRLLQNRLRRRYEVAINPGADQTAPIRVGRLILFPDLLLTSTGRARRPAGLVEVETTESVNNLEAMAQWAHFGRTRLAFSLYVPAGSVEIARRLCADNHVTVAEIWSYHNVGGQVRFTLVNRAPQPSASRPTTVRSRPARPSRKTAKRSAAKATRGARARRPSRAQKRK
jgi:hypothetical protein